MKINLLTVITGMMLPVLPALSCTSLSISDSGGHVYHGRTMELETGKPASSLTYYPAGTYFDTSAPDGTPGASWQSRYKILAITAPLADTNTHELVEGLNNAGLAFSENMKPDSMIQVMSKDQYRRALPVIHLGQWALSNFSSVDEIKAHLQDISLWSSGLKSLGNMKSDFHYAFYDKTGKSIVIEVSDGKVHVYDNPTDVMTNGPSFPWHLENLNNYTQLTNIDRSQATLNALSLSQPDSGIATASLPGSDTSVGRFIRAVFYSHYANQVSNPDEALRELAHIMNRFDRPKNASLSRVSEGSANGGKMTTEYTVWTTLEDLTRGDFYVRGYNNLNYQKFSFADYQHESKPVYQVINLP